MKQYIVLIFLFSCANPSHHREVTRSVNNHRHDKSTMQLILNPNMPIKMQNTAFAGLLQSGLARIDEILVGTAHESVFQERLYLSILLIFKDGTMDFWIPSYPRLWQNKSNTQGQKESSSAYTKLHLLKSSIKKMLFNKFNKQRHEYFRCFINTLRGTEIDSIMEKMIFQRCDWLPEDRAGISCDLVIQNQTCAQFLQNLFKMEGMNYCRMQRISVNVNQRVYKEHPLRSVLQAKKDFEDSMMHIIRNLDLEDDLFWRNRKNYPLFNEVLTSLLVLEKTAKITAFLSTL